MYVPLATTPGDEAMCMLGETLEGIECLEVEQSIKVDGKLVFIQYRISLGMYSDVLAPYLFSGANVNDVTLKPFPAKVAHP